MRIKRLKISKGYYDGNSDTIIHIPNNIKFLKDSTYIGDGIHKGNYHYLGLLTKLDWLEFDKLREVAMDVERNSKVSFECLRHVDLGEDYVLVYLEDADDLNQFELISVNEFNNLIDWNSYNIVIYRDNELMQINKILRISAPQSIDILCIHRSGLHLMSVGLKHAFQSFAYASHYHQVTSNTYESKLFTQQLMYNMLHTSRIMDFSELNHNIDVDAAKKLSESMMDCDPVDLDSYYEELNSIINLKKLITLNNK